MTLDIFTRSYAKDIPFLSYMLRSAHKFARGWDNIVIVVPESDRAAFQGMNLTQEKVYFIEEPAGVSGYMAQQITKLNADCFTEAEYIAYVDSDCLFYKPFNIQEELIKDGKPLMMKTPYAELPPDLPWRACTEKAIGCEAPYETMRRQPIVVKAEFLDRFRRHIAHIHGKTVNDYIAGETTFSEFNALGSYLHKYHNNELVWLDTSTEPVPDQWCYQAWSHGGLTPELRHKYERILK